MTDDNNTPTETAAAPSIIDALAAKHERQERDQSTKRASALELYWRVARESAADEDATASPEQVEQALAVLGIGLAQLRRDIGQLRSVARIRRERRVEDARERAAQAMKEQHDAYETQQAETKAWEARKVELQRLRSQAGAKVMVTRDDVRQCQADQEAAGRTLAELSKRGYSLSDEDRAVQRVEVGRFEILSPDGVYVAGVLHKRGTVAVVPVDQLTDDGVTARRLSDFEEPAPLPDPAEELLAKMPPGTRATIPSGVRRGDAGRELPIINPRLDMPAQPPADAPAAEVQTPPPPPRDGVEVLSGERLHEARKEMKAHLAQQEREQRRSRSPYREDRR